MRGSSLQYAACRCTWVIAFGYVSLAYGQDAYGTLGDGGSTPDADPYGTRMGSRYNYGGGSTPGPSIPYTYAGELVPDTTLVDEEDVSNGIMALRGDTLTGEGLCVDASDTEAPLYRHAST